MHFEDPRPDQGEERILPLINVVFLLLIFFMIAGSLTSQAPFELAPPESASAGATSDEAITILLGREGQLALNNERIQASELKAELESLREAHPDRPVHVRADANVAGNRLVKLLERLREAGIPQVQLLTLRSEA